MSYSWCSLVAFHLWRYCGFGGYRKIVRDKINAFQQFENLVVSFLILDLIFWMFVVVCTLFWQWLVSFTAYRLIILKIILGFMRYLRFYIRISVKILFNDSIRVISRTMFEYWRIKELMKIIDKKGKKLRRWGKGKKNNPNFNFDLRN